MNKANPIRNLSEPMKGLLVLIRMDGYCSTSVARGRTYWALVRRGLLTRPYRHPSAHLAQFGWEAVKLTPKANKMLDELGVAPSQVRCPHCKGSGRVTPSTRTPDPAGVSTVPAAAETPSPAGAGPRK